MPIIDPLNGKRVVVLGFARQGQALARWLPKVGAQAVVSDRRSADELDANPDDYPGVEFVLGDHPESLLDDTDLVCLSGGVPPSLPIVQAAIQRRIPLSNDAELFLERCPAPVIGITGSAGKTTTTALTGAICREAGYTTWVGGNIGDVLLDSLDEIRSTHRVVMELSSFQLELMSVSPPIAAVLNVTPNHLDRHGTMDAYLWAKLQILAHQKQDGMAVLCADDAGSRSMAGEVNGMLAWFSMREMLPDGAMLIGQRLVVMGNASTTDSPQVICERGDIPLRGDHNVLNALGACALAGVQGIEPGAMEAAIKSFEPVPHRLEFVREIDGVTYVNDSIATAPERVIAALYSFKEPLVLLAGGKDKNLSWEQMVMLAVQKSRQIIAFGQAGEIVIDLANRLGYGGMVTRVETVEEAVNEAAQVAKPGDVVLLSPGGTAYDAYKDFAARGDHFRQLVMAL